MVRPESALVVPGVLWSMIKEPVRVPEPLMIMEPLPPEVITPPELVSWLDSVSVRLPILSVPP